VSQLPRWVSYLQALGVPIIAAVIATFGAWIAACQMWIAREKLRLDAFDKQYNRRVAVYEATRTFLADVFHGNISDTNIREYSLKTLDAQFLFNSNLSKYLNEVRDRVAAWNHADSAAEREPPGEQKIKYLTIRNEHLNWITEQGDQRFPLRFEPFLVYKPAKHPWYLRWLPSLDP
jgi:flagellar basal body-associated protein FliL